MGKSDTSLGRRELEELQEFYEDGLDPTPYADGRIATVVDLMRSGRPVPSAVRGPRR